MKDKRKYSLTRKRKAIKRSIICLLLILVFFYCGNFGLLPSSALRETEEYYGTGKTETIIPYHRNSLIKFTGVGLFCLSENENALIHHCAKYNLLIGWYRAVAAVVDCSGDSPVDAGQHSVSGSKSGSTEYYFGRVNDSRIQRVEIGLDKGRDGSIDVRIDHPIFERDGQRYFYQGYVPDDEDDYYYAPYVICYDADGTLVYEAEIKQGSSSYIG